MDTSQLTAYIQQSLEQGAQPSEIRNQLFQSGWPIATIDEAFSKLPSAYTQTTGQQPQTSANPHKVRDGILWIISPFILLICIAMLQFFARLLIVHSVLLNILATLAGMAAVILIPVGLIMGIIKLSQK